MKGIILDTNVVSEPKRPHPDPRERPRQGRGVNGRTRLQAFIEGAQGKDRHDMPHPIAI